MYKGIAEAQIRDCIAFVLGLQHIKVLKDGWLVRLMKVLGKAEGNCVGYVRLQ